MSCSSSNIPFFLCCCPLSLVLLLLFSSPFFLILCHFESLLYLYTSPQTKLFLSLLLEISNYIKKWKKRGEISLAPKWEKDRHSSCILLLLRNVILCVPKVYFTHNCPICLIVLFCTYDYNIICLRHKS